MPQLDRDRVAGERAQQIGEVVARRRRVLEARRETARAARPACRTTPAGRCRGGTRRGRRRWAGPARRAARTRRRASPGSAAREPLLEHPRVRELLIELDRELEARGRALGPLARDLRRAAGRRTSSSPRRCRSARRRSDSSSNPFGRAARRRIEDAVPRALAGRVVPARRADAEVRVCRSGPCRSRR